MTTGQTPNRFSFLLEMQPASSLIQRGYNNQTQREGRATLTWNQRRQKLCLSRRHSGASHDKALMQAQDRAVHSVLANNMMDCIYARVRKTWRGLEQQWRFTGDHVEQIVGGCLPSHTEAEKTRLWINMSTKVTRWYRLRLQTSRQLYSGYIVIGC